MAKTTQERPLEVAPWANDNYNKVMTQKAQERAREKAQIRKIKNALDTTMVAISFIALVVGLILWCKQGYVIQW